MTVRAELCTEISPTGAKQGRILRRVLAATNGTIDLFPAQKQQITRFAIDGFIALAAFLLAVEMHSDFSLPLNNLRPIWLWALVMFIGRPLALMLVTGYRVPWQDIRIADVAELSVASVPPSVLATVLCVSGRPSWAVVPSGVIATELPLFIGMAAATRCLRRAAYEEDFQSKMGSRVAAASINRASISNLLLHRLPVATNVPSPTAWDREGLDTYRDRVVLVTGAGGSIGPSFAASSLVCQFRDCCCSTTMKRQYSTWIENSTVSRLHECQSLATFAIESFSWTSLSSIVRISSSTLRPTNTYR